jgi:hypothetical protein
LISLMRRMLSGGLILSREDKMLELRREVRSRGWLIREVRSRAHPSKLTDNQREEIIQKWLNGKLTYTDLGRMYHVSHNVVARIIKRYHGVSRPG